MEDNWKVTRSDSGEPILVELLDDDGEVLGSASKRLLMYPHAVVGDDLLAACFHVLKKEHAKWESSCQDPGRTKPCLAV